MALTTKLHELRAVAERLALGDAEVRKLRGLFVDLVDVLLGREPNHADVNNSGARFEPPPASQFAHVAPEIPPFPGTPRRQLAAAPPEPAEDPAGPDALAQIERELNEADEKRNTPPNGGH